MRAIYELLNHHIILGLISQNFLAKKRNLLMDMIIRTCNRKESSLTTTM